MDIEKNNDAAEISNNEKNQIESNNNQVLNEEDHEKQFNKYLNELFDYDSMYKPDDPYEIAGKKKTRANQVHLDIMEKYCFFSIKNSNTIMKGIGKDLKHFSRLKNTSLFQEKMQSLTRAHLMHCCNESYRKNIIRY